MHSFQTVLGIVDENRMGHTQPHEHIYIVGTVDQIHCKDICINNFAASMEELKLYSKAGGASVTDANPLATGRDALALRDLSKLTGINIIATTGYHIPKFYPQNHWIWSTTEEKLTELFTEELTEGMYQDGIWFWPEYRTNIKAGLIKAAVTTSGLDDMTVKLLSAAGKASVRTGIPLMIHTEGVDVLRMIDFLCGKIGVSENNLLVCHIDRQADDYSVHKAVAKTGVFMEYDTITLFEFHNVADEIKLLRYMIDEGFLNQLLISTDPTTDRMKKYSGTVGIDYILTQLIPLLELSGFSEDEIFKMTHLNPWKALSMSQI